MRPQTSTSQLASIGIANWFVVDPDANVVPRFPDRRAVLVRSRHLLLETRELLVVVALPPWAVSEVVARLGALPLAELLVRRRHRGGRAHVVGSDAARRRHREADQDRFTPHGTPSA